MSRRPPTALLLAALFAGTVASASGVAVLTPADAVHAPPPLPAGVEQCTAHDLSSDRFVTLALGRCSAAIATAVEQWQPDVLVALGGGILPNGGPGCATTQRAWTTYQLFERLGRRPRILLSGRGQTRVARDLDAADVRCAVTLRTREIAEHAGEARTQLRLRDQIATLERTRHGRLTESEHMCAALLRRYTAAEQPSILAQMILEPSSTSTLENVRRSTPMLVQGGFERVLVVSTFAFPPRGGLDNHPRRAAAGFRAMRPSTNSYRVAAVACPYQYGGPSWSQFEPESPARNPRIAHSTRVPASPAPQATQ